VARHEEGFEDLADALEESLDMKYLETLIA
jgi:hypothetical protein